MMVVVIVVGANAVAMVDCSMVAVVVIAGEICIIRMIRMVRMVRVIWVVWIWRIMIEWIRIIVGIIRIIRRIWRIAPVIIVVVRPVRPPCRIPVRIPIWVPAVVESGSKFDHDLGFGGFFDYINGVDDPFDGVGGGVFLVDFTRFTLDGVGVEIAVI